MLKFIVEFVFLAKHTKFILGSSLQWLRTNLERTSAFEFIVKILSFLPTYNINNHSSSHLGIPTAVIGRATSLGGSTQEGLGSCFLSSLPASTKAHHGMVWCPTPPECLFSFSIIWVYMTKACQNGSRKRLSAVMT